MVRTRRRESVVVFVCYLYIEHVSRMLLFLPLFETDNGVSRSTSCTTFIQFSNCWIAFSRPSRLADSKWLQNTIRPTWNSLDNWCKLTDLREFAEQWPIVGVVFCSVRCFKCLECVFLSGHDSPNQTSKSKKTHNCGKHATLNGTEWNVYLSARRKVTAKIRTELKCDTVEKSRRTDSRTQRCQ